MVTTETNGTPVIMTGNCGGYGCGYGDGFGGGGSWMWAFLIFALLGSGGIWGNRGCGEQLATSADVQRGFDTNEITRKLDGISNGLCDGFYAQNTNNLNGFSETNRNIDNEARNIQMQLADCCCTTQRAIDSVNYNSALNTAKINEVTTQQTQKILNALCKDKIESLQNQVNQLQLQSALCGVVRYPNSMAYNAGTSPFCNCNTYSGCGCGLSA